MIIARANALAKDYKLHKHLQEPRGILTKEVLARKDCNNCRSQVLLQPREFI